MTNEPRSRARVRKDRQIQEVQHDAYRARGKPKEPAVCPECGVLFHAGHWAWGVKPAGAHEHLCPACERIRDHLPAGWVELSGAFMKNNETQILALVRNEAERTRTQHPLERIMAIENEDGKTLVSTTDLHLARRIGEAVHRAFHGDLEVKYSKDESLVRCYWSREA
ncbi:MAG: BCAM0308 family protein [Burkholderiales bacterium]